MAAFLKCIVVSGLIVSGTASLRIVDLTHTHNSDTVYWPGNPAYNFTILSRGMNTALGFWYESNYFGTAEHGGTHVDAPSHFGEGKARVQDIPMSKMVGPGVIIDVTSKVASDPDYRVTVQDLLDWENKYGRIPEGAVVVMNSGWSKRYPNLTLTFGSSTPDDPSTFHFPGFHEDTAEWMMTNRTINVVGVDTPSTDHGQSTHFLVHQVLAKANMPAVENVANLDQIPEFGSFLYVACIKLYDGSGGPARVFASLPLDQPTGSASGMSLCNGLLLTTIIALRALLKDA